MEGWDRETENDEAMLIYRTNAKYSLITHIARMCQLKPKKEQEGAASRWHDACDV